MLQKRIVTDGDDIVLGKDLTMGDHLLVNGGKISVLESLRKMLALKARLTTVPR